MRPGPVSVVRIILDETDILSPPIRMRDVIAGIALARRWVAGNSEALEAGERWEKTALARLSAEIDDLLRMGRPSRVTFNSSSPHLVQGACFVEPRDSGETKASKNRRARTTGYQSLVAALSPQQFEILCGKLIGLLGVDSPRVTRRSADDGIDFYGRLALGSAFYPRDLTPTIQQQLSIWLVGQAKRYLESTTGTAEIRDLVGAISLGRSEAFGSSDSPFPDLCIRVGDPVFAMLVTTGSFSANAWRLLQRSGVIGIDGEMLAAFLADREVAADSDTLTQPAFLTWLETDA